jgi:hypothetical protein
MPSIDLLDDAIGIGGPDKGFGFAVVFAEVSVDGGRRSTSERKTPRCNRRRVSVAKKVSTASAQEQEWV